MSYDMELKYLFDLDSYKYNTDVSDLSLTKISECKIMLNRKSLYYLLTEVVKLRLLFDIAGINPALLH